MPPPDAILCELRPDETLRWSETPGWFALLWAQGSLLSLPLFTAFFVGAFYAIEQSPGNRWFLGIFLTLLYVPALLEVISGFRTRYAITNRRLLILRPSWFSVELESYYAPDIEFVKTTKRRGGSGDVVFSVVKEQSGKRTRTTDVGFFGVAEVAAVETLVLELRGLAPGLSRTSGNPAPS